MCNVGSGLVEKGREEGIVIGEAKSLVETYQEFCKSVEETTRKLMDKFQMSEEEARENVSKYWKE